MELKACPQRWDMESPRKGIVESKPSVNGRWVHWSGVVEILRILGNAEAMIVNNNLDLIALRRDLDESRAEVERLREEIELLRELELLVRNPVSGPLRECLESPILDKLSSLRNREGRS